MLRLHTPGVALVLALVAGMALAQTGEADPPAAGTVPGTGEPRTPVKPKKVLSLKEKEALRAFCVQAANRKDARCEGFVDPSTTAATTATEDS